MIRIERKKPRIKISEKGTLMDFQEFIESRYVKMIPEILRKSMLGQYTKPNGNKNGNVSVSHLLDCPRKVYYSIKEGAVLDLQGVTSMWIGTLIHSALEKVFDYNDVYIDFEVEEGLKVVGYADGINFDGTLYDLKTVPFAGQKAGEMLNSEDRDALQVQIYSTMAGKKGIGIKGLKIVYIGLNDKMLVERSVKMEDKTEFIKTRARELKAALENGKEPKPDPKWDWECKYCQWREGCGKR